MVAVGGVIELKNSGKILIIQRASNLDWNPDEWEIMYGRIDQFENPEDGLLREVKEEVGLNDLKIIDILEVWHIFRGTEKIPENEVIGITYWCRTNKSKIELSDEHKDYKWITPQEALEKIKVEGVRLNILKYIETKKRVDNQF